jgi:hypothetical protein
LEKLVDRRTEAKRECSVRAMAAARWRRQSRRAVLGQEQSGVAREGRARREGVRAALKLGATRGGEGKQEVEQQQQHSGGRGGVLRRRQRKQRSRACQRKKKERRGSEGLVCKNRKVHGPHYKLKFPTDPKA